MTKKILITGATGFVGKHVVQALLNKGVDLRLVVRSDKAQLYQSISSAYEVVETEDVFSHGSDWWLEKCEAVDVVIHLAWYAEPGKYLQSLKNLDCLRGSIELAKGAAQAGVKRFVGVGTCFEYDLDNGRLSIETPLKPASPYAAAKAALYMSLMHWLPLNSIDFAWCRLFYLYGEGEDERRLVPYLHSRLKHQEAALLTSGKQVRDFLDVADAGRILAQIALGNQIGPINICSGVPITVQQLSEKIADIYGRRDLLVFGARSEDAMDPPCVVGIPG